MLESFSTKATVTKIHAMHGKMLTSQDYKELLNKQSVSEIAAYLKNNTRYHDVLTSIDTNTIHRGFLESLIRKSNFNTYVKLCKFQRLDHTPFYNYEIVREEIEQILSCILHINAKKSEEYISTLPSYLLKHASFDLIELAKTKTFEELLKVIKNTSYWNLLKNVKPTENGLINYLECEVLLRTEYYKTMFETIDKDFSGKVAQNLKEDVKIQVDLINFINAYRMKVFFNANSDTIKKSMLPFFGRMSQRQMFKFYDAKNKEEMLELFNTTSYSKRIDEIDQDILEKKLYEIRYESAKSSLQNAQSAPVALYSFMFLCQIEAQNIISIIEGIRYKESPSFIEKLLII